MADEITVPILPCRSIDDQIDFYTTLGFEITYRQERPNTYAVVQRGGIVLHFFSMKGYEPAESYSTCLVVSPDADALYQTFRSAIHARYGKHMTRGIPRMTVISDKSNGPRGFHVVDPGGNWIRIVQQAGAKEAVPALEIPPSPLSKALAAAQTLADNVEDVEKAIRTLDTALARAADAPAVHRAQALVTRAALAADIGDRETATARLADLRRIDLSEAERAALQAEFQRADDIEQALHDENRA